MNPDWLADFEAAERHLAEHADWKTDTPAPLLVVNGPIDLAKAQALAAWLLERGWRIAVDTEGDLLFFAPGPLTDPGDETRISN